MEDQDKTKEELANELAEMRQRISELEASLVVLKQRDEAGQEAQATCKATIEAFDGLIYVCSSNYEVEFMNERFIQRTGHNPIGEKCYRAIHDRDEICPWCVNERVQLGETVRWEVQSPKDNRWYYIVNTPVRRRDGTISKMAMIQDVTERKRAENIILARFRLVEYSASHSLDELLEATLDEVEALTDSSIGFYHFLDTDQRTLRLQAWSTRTLLEMCTAEGKGLHYSVDEAGAWADCVRERKPVIHNSYSALTHKKGLPAGHADVIRELVVPVFRGDRVVGILGVGNKAVDYDASDIEIVSGLADLAWDITERKQVEEQLRESEERFRCMFEHSLDAMLLTAPDGRIFKANPAACQMFGRSEEEVCQIGRSGTVDTNDPAHNMMLEERRLKSSWRGELNHKRRDGTVFPAEISSAIFSTASGEERTSLVIRDISEPKRAEAEMRTILARMDGLMDATPDLVYFKDLDGRFLVVNKAYERFAGKSKEDIVGRSFWEVLPADLAQQADKGDKEALKHGKAVRLEQHAIGKDGEPIFYDAVKFPVLDELGCVVGLGGATRDITNRKRVERALREARDELEERVRERTSEIEKVNESLRREIVERKLAEEAVRRSEELFRTVFESAQDLIFIKDLSRKYVKVNPAVEKLLGLRGAEIVGLEAADLLDRQSALAINANEVRILAGDTIEDERTVMLRGTPVVLHGVGAPLKDSTGKIVGICAVYRDVTDRKMAETVPQVSTYDDRSEAMRATASAIRLAASSGVIVLLQGESGSGKDHAASRIHLLSDRSGGPFFSINCAAVPHELAESELFGHEAGAFTGAAKRKRGLLELAEGGTILLNEIGELSLSLQAKLLAFLDTKSFLRVGGEKQVQVNARLIAATHRDLEAEVGEGRFLKPLFYRLSIFPIHVPSLRDRVEDIPALAEDILRKLATEVGLYKIPLIEPRHIAELSSYHWPGNIRELRNVLERSLILWTGGNFNLAIPRRTMNESHWSYVVNYQPGKTARDAMDEVKRFLCEAALQANSGNKKEAARSLDLSRDAFYRYIKRLSIVSDKNTQ